MEGFVSNEQDHIKSLTFHLIAVSRDVTATNALTLALIDQLAAKGVFDESDLLEMADRLGSWDRKITTEGDLAAGSELLRHNIETLRHSPTVRKTKKWSPSLLRGGKTDKESESDEPVPKDP
jgi:hypothetical protein